jgi:hypothetical protein
MNCCVCTLLYKLKLDRLVECLPLVIFNTEKAEFTDGVPGNTVASPPTISQLFIQTFPTRSMMGLTISTRVTRLFGAKENCILILGLDAAGKMTILYKLKLGEMILPAPPPRLEATLKRSSILVSIVIARPCEVRGGRPACLYAP